MSQVSSSNKEGESRLFQAEESRDLLRPIELLLLTSSWGLKPPAHSVEAEAPKIKR